MYDLIKDTFFLNKKAKVDSVERIVVGAIIEHDDRILIVKRASTENFLPNIDEIPGGKVEANETILQAVIREVREETGLEVQGIYRYVNFFDYRSRSNILTRQFNFVVDVKTISHVLLNPKEHQKYFWINSNEINNYTLTEEVKKSLDKFWKSRTNRENIVNIDSIAELLLYLNKEDHLFLDFDDTICTSKEFIGSEISEKLLIEELIGSGEKDAVQKAAELWQAIQENNEVRFVEEIFPQILQAASEVVRTINVITSRPPTLDKATSQQMLSLGLKFMPINTNNVNNNSKLNCDIIFCNMKPKHLAISELNMVKQGTMILVDDKYETLDKASIYFGEQNIKFLGLFYNRVSRTHNIGSFDFQKRSMLEWYNQKLNSISNATPFIFFTKEDVRDSNNSERHDDKLKIESNESTNSLN